MSRTPLFGLIARSLRVAHQSLQSPLPADELLAKLHEDAGARRTLTRRQFVGTGVALGALAALPACSPGGGAATTTPTPARGGRRGQRPVVIVGAGIAGLTAAYRLRAAGVPVALYEAQARVGGRMFSLRDHFADGQVVELGGELIDTGHTRIRALAGELGISTNDLASDDPALHEVWHFGGARRSEAEILAAFRPLAQRIEQARAAMGTDDPTYDTPGQAAALDRMSLAEWLDGEGVSGWLRTLLDVGYTTEYGLEPDRQSALNLLTMIGTASDEFAIFGDSDERFHVQGGNDRITTALAGHVSDTIHTGHVLEAVEALAGGGVACTFRRDGTSIVVPADQLILALPFTLLRDVRLAVPLSDTKRRAIAELGYGANAKLMVGFGERVWRTRHGSNGSTLAELPFQLTWETSRGQRGRAGVLTNFTGGRQALGVGAGTAATQAAVLVSQLEQLYPGIDATRAGMREARFHWPTHPWTRGSYASYLPGQWTGIRGAEGESAGAVHFAGEHCSLAAQGFMEGGCETGERAARAVLTGLGVSLRRPEPRRLLEVA